MTEKQLQGHERIVAGLLDLGLEGLGRLMGELTLEIRQLTPVEKAARDLRKAVELNLAPDGQTTQYAIGRVVDAVRELDGD